MAVSPLPDIHKKAEDTHPFPQSTRVLGGRKTQNEKASIRNIFLERTPTPRVKCSVLSLQKPTVLLPVRRGSQS